MSLSILFNQGAALANRMLEQTDKAATDSLVHLSAGMRVISARDDAASLAIGSRLKADVAAMRQAGINAIQGTSLAQIADGATARVGDLLVRMKTLAVQAGSGQLSGTERAMLDAEFQLSKSEIGRIAADTQFNGTNLLDSKGFVFTVRSLPSNGVLTLEGEQLTLGSSFTQEDMDLGRIVYTHDGGGSAADSLVVSIGNTDGDAIGTVAGEVDIGAFETTEYLAAGGLANINASTAYARGGTGAGVTVAVIDSGVDLFHFELDGNIAGGVDIVDGVLEGGAGTAGTTSGDGYDSHNANPSDGHGTHVAGIIAAEKNDAEMHGVAFGASILAIKATQPADGLFDPDDVADAIDYARLNGADVINMSLSFGQGVGIPNQITAAMVRAVNAGIVLVAAAGNDALNDPDFPASFAIDATAQGALIAVGATDSADNIADFSNKAGTAAGFVVMAPGVDITSAQSNGARFATSWTVPFSGTSMASPHVAGAAAILTEMYGSGTTSNLTGAEIANLLITSAADLGAAGVDHTYGQGLLDLDRATAAQMTLNISVNAPAAGALEVATGQSSTVTSGVLDADASYTSITSALTKSTSIKVGTGKGDSHELNIKTTSLTLSALELTSSDVTSKEGANAANTAVGAALDRVYTARAELGSTLNRLEYAAATIAQTTENTEQARSNLLDLDVASEMGAFISKQILSQVGISMLAQANLRGQQVLKLFNT